MAKGRMFVKEFSYDDRIWGISERAALLFASCIPHIETDGTLPRAASMLRLMCFPSAKVTTQDTESALLEWLSTKPPLCVEHGRRLFFTDFFQSNEGLDFMRMRKMRAQKDIGPVTDSYSSYGQLHKFAEVKRSEVKRITNRTTAPSAVDFTEVRFPYGKDKGRIIADMAADECQFYLSDGRLGSKIRSALKARIEAKEAERA